MYLFSNPVMTCNELCNVNHLLETKVNINIQQKLNSI